MAISKLYIIFYLFIILRGTEANTLMKICLILFVIWISDPSLTDGTGCIRVCTSLHKNHE